MTAHFPVLTMRFTTIPEVDILQEHAVDQLFLVTVVQLTKPDVVLPAMSSDPAIVHWVQPGQQMMLLYCLQMGLSDNYNQYAG